VKTDRQKEWTRRILACAHAPRTPRVGGADARYRDENALLWLRIDESWVLNFNDAATRAGLLERLRTAQLHVASHAYPTYVGKSGSYETQPLDDPGEVLALLYEAHMLRLVDRTENAPHVH
jgi:hypothetical protein